MYEIKYNNKKIEYTLVRLKIKNMYIQIKNEQVIVKAPIKLNEKYINEFVNKKSKWIYENLEKSRKTSKTENIEQQDIYRLSEIVKESVEKYSKILEVKPGKVRIKDIKYAWGSCSSNRNISINMHLAKKPKEVIEYVVLHEMCHLIHMNHSKQFWNLVERNMPKYKEYKKKLKN
ncbi:MAG: M48 family metallopeptidase [Clostridia bacterium]|nr:M48 family metallopeptidase [Clostridia bacterium]